MWRLEIVCEERRWYAKRGGRMRLEESVGEDKRGEAKRWEEWDTNRGEGNEDI